MQSALSLLFVHALLKTMIHATGSIYLYIKKLALGTNNLGLLSVSTLFHAVDCAVCSEEYWKGSSYTCTKCSDNVWRKTAAAVAAVITIIIAFATLKYMVSVGGERAKGGITARLIRLVPLHSVKIIIVAWQILTQVNNDYTRKVASPIAMLHLT